MKCGASCHWQSHHSQAEWNNYFLNILGHPHVLLAELHDVAVDLILKFNKVCLDWNSAICMWQRCSHHSLPSTDLLRVCISLSTPLMTIKVFIPALTPDAACLLPAANHILLYWLLTFEMAHFYSIWQSAHPGHTSKWECCECCANYCAKVKALIVFCSAVLSVTAVKLVKHDFPLAYLCWLFTITFLSFTCAEMDYFKTCSIILLETEMRLTGPWVPCTLLSFFVKQGIAIN